jgi:hypothetical protein
MPQYESITRTLPVFWLREIAFIVRWPWLPKYAV